jgi:hypothetical protein
MNRGRFLLSTGSLTLAGCAGGATSALLTPPSTSTLYANMRAIAVPVIYNKDGSVIALPEKQNLVRPFDVCGPGTLSRNRVHTLDCDEPVILTVYATAGNEYALYTDENSGPYGGYFLNWGYAYGGKGSSYQTNTFNWDCAVTQVAAGLSGVSALAQMLSKSTNASLYGANSIQAAKWFLTGTITAGEFIAIFMTFCVSWELVGALAAVGTSLALIYVAMRCSGSTRV